jgi:hypothetical protein
MWYYHDFRWCKRQDLILVGLDLDYMSAREIKEVSDAKKLSNTVEKLLLSTTQGAAFSDHHSGLNTDPHRSAGLQGTGKIEPAASPKSAYISQPGNQSHSPSPDHKEKKNSPPHPST